MFTGLTSLLFLGITLTLITKIKACECPPENPPTDILCPHESDCSQFYKCSYGEKVLQDCPPGLGFDPDQNQCDWLENVNCQGSNGTEIENENGNQGLTNEDDQSCTLNDDIIFIPHETDCDKFYKCSNGSKILMECPNGLLFNSDVQACDWPENVVCEENTECSAYDGIDVLLPHEADCEKFYQCVHGEKIERGCPDGLHFNPEIDRCDWPGNVNCTIAEK